jgi:DNA-binding transcriptional regulator YbjK
LQIVADTGADAVTHRRVAEVAQLPLASTTYYFDSKEQLLTAALEVAAERDLARLHALAERRRRLPAAPEHAVALVLDTAGELSEDERAAGRRSLLAGYTLLLEAARRPALRELTRRWTEAYMTAVTEQLQRAGSAEPAQDAQLLLAAADGLLIAQLSTGEAIDPRPALERLARTLTGAPR